MKFLNIIKTAFFGSLFVSICAWGDTPYSKTAFDSAQKRNEKIVLDFYADWCPTCKVQAQSLKKLEDKGELKNLTIFKVDFDNEEALKKSLNVNAQSTLVTFYGNIETGRSTGITNEKDLNEFLTKSLKSLTLKDQLRMMNEASKSKLPVDKKKVMDQALENLKKSNIEDKVIKVGKKIPDVSLVNAQGKKVKLSDLRKKGPVIITFYRGSWCPYCNAQLSNFQQNLVEFQKKGAQLVAVTPEKPDLSVLLAENKKLEFEILHDKDNKFASKLGLVFGVTRELKEIYQQFGIDLEKSQGNADWKLPVPATFIVGKDGKIFYEFVDADYTKRASAEDILSALDQVSKK